MFTIFTEEQLRQELGDLTESTRTDDYMPKHVLEGIINHYNEVVKAAALSKVSRADLPMDMFDPAEIDLESSLHADVVEGEIPFGRFPFTPKALLNGVSATLVSDIEFRIRTAPTTHNLVSIQGNKVYVHPTTHDKVTLFLCNEEVLILRVAPGEIASARADCLAEARRMVSDRLKIREIQSQPTEFQEG